MFMGVEGGIETSVVRREKEKGESQVVSRLPKVLYGKCRAYMGKSRVK